jgi:LmbE family N-acetylglucosaminyl deacetylase
MRRLTFDGPDGAGLRLLVIGAHADDIEIGCGGTILRLAAAGKLAAVHWVVLSAHGSRADEARAAAASVLGDIPAEVEVGDLRDGYFPYLGAAVKDTIQGLAAGSEVDVVLTHRREDLHQDHRLVSELTWNAFRDHVILEYEIPKYDGDLGTPNTYVELTDEIARRKVDLLTDAFPSQAGKHWFSPETFWALLRLRGIECRAPSGYAEGFTTRKLLI